MAETTHSHGPHVLGMRERTPRPHDRERQPRGRDRRSDMPTVQGPNAYRSARHRPAAKLPDRGLDRRPQSHDRGARAARAECRDQPGGGALRSRVANPKRLRRGNTMTVAVYEDSWLRYNGVGVLDLLATSGRHAERNDFWSRRRHDGFPASTAAIHPPARMCHNAVGGVEAPSHSHHAGHSGVSTNNSEAEAA